MPEIIGKVSQGSMMINLGDEIKNNMAKMSKKARIEKSPPLKRIIVTHVKTTANRKITS